jgi:NMD protein affecting ribosome stability and mRNA decay
MMEETGARCPHCGGPLDARALEGLCPRCLLARSLDPAPPPPGEAEATDDE